MRYQGGQSKRPERSGAVVVGLMMLMLICLSITAAYFAQSG